MLVSDGETCDISFTAFCDFLLHQDIKIKVEPVKPNESDFFVLGFENKRVINYCWDGKSHCGHKAQPIS